FPPLDPRNAEPLPCAASDGCMGSSSRNPAAETLHQLKPSAPCPPGSNSDSSPDRGVHPFMNNNYPYVICDMRQASFGASFGCRKLLSVASRYAEKLATEMGHEVGVWSNLSSKYMAEFASDHNTYTMKINTETPL